MSQVSDTPTSVDEPTRPSSDIAFTDAVKAVQKVRGSRDMFAAKEAQGGFRTVITPDLAAFLETVTTSYLATASADGQPYVQHRGGPPGFLRLVDGQTIGFADYAGNRQYVTTGNLAENPRAQLFLMDYENRRRVKLWGKARVVEGDKALEQRLFPEGYRARIEQVILFTLEAWDINCSQHIPQMLHAADVATAVAQLQARNRELDQENTALKVHIAALKNTQQA